MFLELRALKSLEPNQMERILSKAKKDTKEASMFVSSCHTIMVDMELR